jgi:hypothetical protein
MPVDHPTHLAAAPVRIHQRKLAIAIGFAVALSALLLIGKVWNAGLLFA